MVTFVVGEDLGGESLTSFLPRNCRPNDYLVAIIGSGADRIKGEVATLGFETLDLGVGIGGRQLAKDFTDTGVPTMRTHTIAAFSDEIVVLGGWNRSRWRAFAKRYGKDRFGIRSMISRGLNPFSTVPDCLNRKFRTSLLN